MKNWGIYIICLLTIFSGCKRGRLAKEPITKPYSSIKESKVNNAFVEELKSQQPYFEIEGHKYIIEAAWIEHPHVEKNMGDVIANNLYCFVMEIKYEKNNKINLGEYIEGMGNDSTSFWFFLMQGREKNPYIKLQYRTTKKSQNWDKYFLFNKM